MGAFASRAYSAAMARNVIFDCDGVLVDTELVANRVLAELVSEIGVPTTVESAMSIYMGRSWASCVEILERKLGRPPPEDFHGRYLSRVMSAWERELQLVPGVVDALDAISLPNCVASSGEHQRMRLTLQLAGLLHRFEGRLFSATEVEHGKPAPDLFLHAAERMGFDPAATAVVEDTVPGVEAGRAAGMKVLAFARFVAAEDLAAAGGEVFDDMRALPGLLMS